MLDERIVALARKTAGAQLKDLDQPLVLRANANRAKLHGNGRLYLVLMDLYREEIVRRAEIAWRNLHRAHNSMGSPITNTLGADLLETFRANLDAVVQELRLRFDKDMERAPVSAKGPSWADRFTAVRDHELARYEGEIEHYVASLEASHARGVAPAASYVFHGNVGAVMTGPGAVANVTQNIGAGEREELRKALEAVKTAISEAPELIERDRRELSEIADEAMAEIAKESPNSRRLKSVLESLAATVQGIASGPGAYEVLRAAAAAIGITL